MVVRLATGGLIAVGAWLILLGAQSWYEHRQVATVVRAFMTALENGDRAAALSLFDPTSRAAIERQPAEGKALLWVPTLGLQYRIHHVTVAGSHATVQLWIDKDAFVIQPVLHLARNSAGEWAIDRVAPFQIDPLWEDLLEQQAETAGEQLAQELNEALVAQVGVSIQRVPMTATR